MLLMVLMVTLEVVLAIFPAVLGLFVFSEVVHTTA